MDDKYLHTPLVAAVVPLLQAVITGIILGTTALMLAIVFKATRPLMWGGAVSVLSMAATWLNAQRRWHEMTSPPELYQDDTVSTPPEVLVRLTSETEAYHEIDARLPATMAQMQDLAAGLLAGQSFTERNFTGSGKPFSSANFRSLRDELVKRGMLAAVSDKDPRAGYRLTYAGKAAMRAFLPDDPPPYR